MQRVLVIGWYMQLCFDRHNVLHVMSEKYCEVDQESTFPDVDQQVSGNCEIRGNTNKARETDMTPQNNSRGNLFSCDKCNDCHANATCHEEHTREMEEKKKRFGENHSQI